MPLIMAAGHNSTFGHRPKLSVLSTNSDLASSPLPVGTLLEHIPYKWANYDTGAVSLRNTRLADRQEDKKKRKGKVNPHHQNDFHLHHHPPSLTLFSSGVLV